MAHTVYGTPLMHRLTLAATAILSLVAATDALAADFAPTRPVRLIVPFPPGGGSDAMARLVAPRLSEVLGQQVVVDNRAGGNTVIGAGIVANAPADGHTLLLANASHTINAAVVPKLPFDAIGDFTAVAPLANVSNVLVVNSSVPVKSVSELLALARAKPGQLNFASAGPGTATHLGGVLLQSLGKIDFVIVPYKGVGPAMTELLGGQVSLGVAAMTSVMQHVKTGRLRALGVTSARRSVLAPDLPTVAEQGLPGYEVANWYGLIASRGTSRTIAASLNAITTRIMAEPELQKRMAAQGLEPFQAGTEQFDAYLRAEVARWVKLAKAYGITAE